MFNRMCDSGINKTKLSHTAYESDRPLSSKNKRKANSKGVRIQKTTSNSLFCILPVFYNTKCVDLERVEKIRGRWGRGGG